MTLVTAAACAWHATEGAIPDNGTVTLDGYAATVNGEVITVGDVLMAAQPLNQQAQLSLSGAAMEAKVAENYRRALDLLVEQTLMGEEIKRRLADKPELELPDRVIEDQIAAMVRERFDGNRDLFLAAMARDGVTLSEFREQTRDRLNVMRMQRDEIYDRIFVPPSAVREAYKRRRTDFQTPEEIRLRAIVMQKGTGDEQAVKRALADKTHARLVAGENFAALATQVSEGPKAAQGGDLGWMKTAELRTELAQATADLKPGAFTPVIDTGTEFYIVQVEGRKTAGAKAFEEVRGELERELRRAEEEKLRREWMERLRNRHIVRVLQPEPPD